MDRSRHKGAPLKALLMIMLCWTGGRFIWEINETGSQEAANEIAILPVIEFNLPNEQLTGRNESERSLILSQYLPQTRSPSKSKITEYFSQTLHQVFQAAAPSLLEQGSLHFSASGIQSPSAPADSGSDRYVPDSRAENIIAPTVAINKPPKRWSGYFWIFGRQERLAEKSDFSQDAPLSAPSSQGGQYGGSQAGAILSYRLSGRPEKNISAYARLSGALSVSGQEEIAIGIKAKPIENIPVTFHAEQRFRDVNEGTLGNAFYVVTGTGPDVIASNVSLQTYGQAGYVSGAENSYFYDASAIARKPVLSVKQLEIAVGGGIWAGGQENIRRLDIGPVISAEIPIVNNSARVSLGWRQRIEGNANPGSGLAITMSAGF